MTLNRVKLGCAVLATVVTLRFLTKTLIWNKIIFPASNLPNFAELIKNELMKIISKKFYQHPIFCPTIQFIAAY